MRLPANRREWIEALCRAGGFALLAYLLFQSLLPQGKTASEEIRTARVSDLAMLTKRDSAKEFHFVLDATPSVLDRSWQRALHSAGSRISWSGNLHPVAISAKPNARPERGYTVSAYAADNSDIRIRDAISVLDSATSGAHFISTPVAVTSGAVLLSARHDSASAELSDSALLRPILVIGKAGWETKFVLAALEEAGWKTSAIIFVAPSINTTQGTVASIDTAHYSAVIALDEFASSRSREIASFVQSGGGLILGEAAARAPGLLEFRVTVGSPVPRQGASTLDTISRGSAPVTPLVIKSVAVPLEQRGRDIAVAAMRLGFGRVAQLGYNDTWRWRMQGDARALADHRDWWSGVISQVAYAPRISARHWRDNRAPYADLVDIAGNATPGTVSARHVDERTSQFIWIMLLASLLLIEWTSRRLRGVR